MAAADPNLEWLGHVQPTGLVVAPSVLNRYGLTPQEQLRPDGDAVVEFLAGDQDKPALPDPWAFFATILGWQPAFVAGAPGGPGLPDELSAEVPEADTALVPTWAVREPDGGWQMLVRIEAPGINPDARGALAGWEATPHQRLERLLRETGIPTGLLITDTQLRLVYAPRGETSGWAAFPLRELAVVGGRPMLGGLKLLLNATRLFTDGRERRLPNLLHASREAQAEISATLATQVLGALHELLRGLHAADRERVERLAARRPAHLYEGLLTVLLRLIFLLYGEDRNLLPSRADGPAQALYQEGYGVRSLHAKLLGDRARHPDTMEERRGAWGRLLALFRLVHAGDGSGWIRSRGGKLFDPGAFPFLEGRNDDDRPTPPHVTDGCMLRVLDGLLVLGGEKLSYRTLDVQHIGSVYETVMGFTVLAMPEPALAIKAGKNNRTPVFLDLTALSAKRGKEREKFLKDEADRSGQLPARVSSALAAAPDAAALAEALRPIVDERGSPHGPVPAGTPLLQPTDERRRTGSHYTPRSLTEPIVRHALEPTFERLGPDATPEQVLALKVCDPAMGSGAFLVEACRQLATRLVTAWTKHPRMRPPVAEDEDEDLLARRLVAQRCLYGVDRNPMATDLARLSLWLATLARDHEFTFLDHALKSGDSLVGLSAHQIAGLRWQDGQSDVAPFDGFLRQRIAQVTEGRRAIREAPDGEARAIQEQRFRHVEGLAQQVRLLGDSTLAAFFSSDKPRAREQARVRLGVVASQAPEKSWPRVAEAAAAMTSGPSPLRPFHWEIEFPEVFTGSERGFDAIVGNPPFLGGARISSELSPIYLDYLLSEFKTSGDKTDLVLYFFARAFQLLRVRGAAGLVATNTIAQGDSRSTLRILKSAGYHIYRATRRLSWPGEATVIVTILHMSNKYNPQRKFIDERPCERISVYLKDSDVDDDPQMLFENSGIAYEGFGPYGSGFVLNEGSPELEILQSDSRNSSIIFDYVGGEDILNDPYGKSDRKVIYTGKIDRSELDRKFPTAYEHIEKTVKSERAKKSKRVSSMPWWQFLWPRTELKEKMMGVQTVFVRPRVAKHHAFMRVGSDVIVSNSANVICSDDVELLAVLQSRLHEAWARSFSSSMKDDLRYTPTDCFRTFPFPKCETNDEFLSAAGRVYEASRLKVMISRNEGLTRTYNRFHDRADSAPDIVSLRDLHHKMDVGVLRAYGWIDLADRAVPVFLSEENEPDHRYQGRLFWSEPFRDEVLARLLELNSIRAAKERALGLSPGKSDDSGDDQDEAA